ncbi:hypothetical protein O9929_27760 [Vibrio lentus]|nr:hypothetical protein [Vibrio lentus]
MKNVFAAASLSLWVIRKTLRSGDKSQQNIDDFELVKHDLGYGLLVEIQRQREAVDATEQQMKQTAKRHNPNGSLYSGVSASWWCVAS